jgi:hypothetical protein
MARSQQLVTPTLNVRSLSTEAAELSFFDFQRRGEMLNRAWALKSSRGEQVLRTSADQAFSEGREGDCSRKKRQVVAPVLQGPNSYCALKVLK